MGRFGLRRRAEARGAAAVEFALLLPLLMVIVFGIIDYGDMLSVRQSVSQAAAEGARAAAVSQAGTDADKTAAAASAVTDALASQHHTCKTGASGCKNEIINCPNDATKKCARVKVVIDYSALVPGFGLVLPSTLSYTAVARVS
ncbi:MAG TPA: TadE family protein [Nocardioides sp.]|nr:TadE family protein [Nocardioides sp.]